MADLNSSLASLLQVPGLQELMNSAITQQRQNAPLRTAVTQQAVNMLPNSAFTRPDIAAIPQANYSTPAPSGSNLASNALKVGGGAAIGALLAKLLGGAGGSGSGGSFNAKTLVDALKKMFQKNGGNAFPTQPNTSLPSYDPFSGYGPVNTPGGSQGGDFPGLTPGVDTSWSFGGIPGGYPDNPEDPNSAAPDWASLLPGGGSGGASDNTNWGDE